MRNRQDDMRCDLASIWRECRKAMPDAFVCIAGGAVRDHLIGVEAKDVDVFVGGSVQQVAAAVVAADWTPDLESRESSMECVVGNFVVMGHSVQVMASEKWGSVESVLDIFDWDICRHAYEEGKITSLGNLPSRGMPLELHCVSRPISTMARAARFCARFGMHVEAVTLMQVFAYAVKAVPTRYRELGLKGVTRA